MKVLLAENTKDLNKVLCAVLEHGGFTVDPVFDGVEVLEHIERDSYDCIVLDIMMPRKDGIEALKEIREKNILTPVLMLTAKSEIDDRVAGLDAGADDYLTKPFAMKELMARVRALKDLSFKDIRLHAGTFELACENSVRLSVKEFELMQLFMLNQNHFVTSDYILNQVWSREPDAQTDTVRLYVSYLNRKLKAIASDSQIGGDSVSGFQLE